MVGSAAVVAWSCVTVSGGLAPHTFFLHREGERRASYSCDALYLLRVCDAPPSKDFGCAGRACASPRTPTHHPTRSKNKNCCEHAAVTVFALGFIVSFCATVAVARRALPSAHRVMIGLMIVPVLAAMTV